MFYLFHQLSRLVAHKVKICSYVIHTIKKVKSKILLWKINRQIFSFINFDSGIFYTTPRKKQLYFYYLHIVRKHLFWVFSNTKAVIGWRMKIKHATIFVLSILSISCVVYFVYFSEKEVPLDEDTGRSREETERFMREIGYVQ